MNKQVRKYIINITILLVITALALYFVLKDDAEGVWLALRGADIRYMGICVALAFSLFFLDAFALVLLARLYQKKYPFYKGFLNHMIGKFFSGITPSASGGQFAQAHTFYKQGIPLANSASVLMMSYIVYEISVILFGSGTLIYSAACGGLPSGMMNLWGWQINIVTFSIIGFVLNLGIILLMFVFAFNQRIHRFAVGLIIRIGSLFHIIKKERVNDKRIEFNAKVEAFRMEFKRLISNGKVLVCVLAIYLVRSFLFHSIPYFAILSCIETPGINYFDTVSLSSLCYMITQLIPIPGASGGAEYVYSKMFSPLLGAQAAGLKSSILVWRFATFYLELFLGAIIFTVYHESPKLETLHYSSRTLLEIEVIHLNDGFRPPEKKDRQISQLEIHNVSSYFDAIKKELQENLEANSAALEKEERQRRRRRRNGAGKDS